MSEPLDPVIVIVELPSGVLPTVVIVSVELPDVAIEEGLKEQFAPAGNPEHDSDTGWLRVPPTIFTDTLNFALPPELMLALDGLAPMVKSMPAPFSATSCELTTALSVSIRVPLVGPAVLGAKLTRIVQLASLGKAGGQLFVSKYCWLATMLPMAKLGIPKFVKVTAWDELVVPTGCAAKERDVADSEAVGFGPRATPFKETTRLAPFVPFTVSVPLTGPASDPDSGSKVTL